MSNTETILLPALTYVPRAYPPWDPHDAQETGSITIVGAEPPQPPDRPPSVNHQRDARRKEAIVLAAMYWAYFLTGWNDATSGPLIPRIQEVYHANFTIVSFVFIGNCIGFLSGSVANVYLTESIPFGLLMVLSSLCEIVAYAIQAPAPPFPVLIIGYVLSGFGISIQVAQVNTLVASIRTRSEEKMGLLHASYGLGALCAPLVGTQFAQIPHWSFHWMVSLGIAVSNTLILAWATRGRTLDEVLTDIGSAPIPTSTTTSWAPEAEGQTGRDSAPSVAAPAAQESLFKQILKMPPVHALAFYILVYVGTEVTIGGWIVTFVINERGGGPSAGYISSGFFGGMMVGRLALLWVNRKIGERRAIFLYTALAIALELTIWFVPSLIGNAISVSIIGMLLGPMYPICMNHSRRILPRKVLSASIGWIAGLGQAGSALLPFMTGALASRFGIQSLQPLIVAMMVVMAGLWALVPGTHRRVD